ncbi:MAG: metallophosphoesterase [Archangium sp.]|nr:metallophosphoesterase [Archangium sp.]
MTRLVFLLCLVVVFGCCGTPSKPGPTGGGAGAAGGMGNADGNASAGGTAGGAANAGGTATAGGTAAGGAASAGGFAGGAAAGGTAAGSSVTAGGTGSAGGVASAGGAASAGGFARAGGSAAGGSAADAGVSIVRFIAVGDTGKGNAGQNAVGQAMGTICAQRGCDFVVLLGDNFYPTGVTSVTDPQWQTAFVQPYSTVNAPFYAVLGNHDYGGDGAGYEANKADVEVAYSQVNPKWRMPSLHYRFTQGHAEFFALDTNRSFWGPNGTGDTQTRADINAWLGASTATWKIALGHHPYKSNGPHGNAGNYDCQQILGQCVSLPLFTDGRHIKNFLETIVCGRADVYLSGHDHSLQWLTPTCNGTHLMVSGGGASATTNDTTNPVHYQTTDLGFLYVELNGRTFTGTFYGETGNVLFTRSFTK